jgi:hypothetical protein
VADSDVVTSMNRTPARCPSVPFLSVWDLAQLFALVALALLASLLGRLVLGAVLTELPLGAFLITLVRTSAVQNLVVLFWAGTSGILFLFGAGRLARMRRARLLALVAGMISPWVLLGVGQLEGHLWPSFRETSGPLDRPLMTLPLLLCALLTPWLAGRAARAGAQVNGSSRGRKEAEPR